MFVRVRKWQHHPPPKKKYSRVPLSYVWLLSPSAVLLNQVYQVARPLTPRCQILSPPRTPSVLCVCVCLMSVNSLAIR